MWSHKPFSDKQARWYRVGGWLLFGVTICAVYGLVQTVPSALAEWPETQWAQIIPIVIYLMLFVLSPYFGTYMCIDLERLDPGQLGELYDAVKDDEQSRRLLAEWVTDGETLRLRDAKYLVELVTLNRRRKRATEAAEKNRTRDREARDALLNESGEK